MTESGYEQSKAWTTYRHPICNPLIVINGHSWWVYHVLSNQLDGSIPNSWWAIKEMALNSSANIRLTELSSSVHWGRRYWTLTAVRIVESLVTIWPRAFKAFVRIKMAGASRATSMTLKIGLNELRRLWIVPISSARTSIRSTSSWELNRIIRKFQDLAISHTHPTLKTSVVGSFHTSNRAILRRWPNCRSLPSSLIFKSSSASGCSIQPATSFNADETSWQSAAAVNSLAL